MDADGQGTEVGSDRPEAGTGGVRGGVTPVGPGCQASQSVLRGGGLPGRCGQEAGRVVPYRFKLQMEPGAVCWHQQPHDLHS